MEHKTKHSEQDRLGSYSAYWVKYIPQIYSSTAVLYTCSECGYNSSFNFDTCPRCNKHMTNGLWSGGIIYD